MTQHEVEPGKSFTYRFVAGAPGTYWYHCHVQDHVHPLMGLAGMLIIEPNRPHNHFAHLIPGRRPHHVDGEGDARGIPERIFAGVHGHRRPAQPHPGRLFRSARDREAHASRVRLDAAQAQHLHAQRPLVPVHHARHADPGEAGRDDEAAHPQCRRPHRPSAHPRPSSDADASRRPRRCRRARASPATPSTSARRSASISRCAPAATACTRRAPASG